MKRTRKIKKTSIAVFIIVLLILCGGLVGGAFVLKTMQASYEMRIDALESQIETNTHGIYVAATDIKYGDVITADMVVRESHLLSYPADLFTAEDIGSIAKVSVPAGTVMLAPMCEAEQKEVSEREVEFTCFYVSQNVEVGDYIDVRIRYQTGEDFVILSKKRVERLSLTNATCFLMVNEVELQMMASAIVDVSEYDAVLYSNVYPQPEIQMAAAITYPVRSESHNLIQPLAETLGVEYVDLSTVRTALEERIKDNTGGSSVIDVSNLKDYNKTETSNTNDKGTNISSDYEADAEVDEQTDTQ